MARLLQVTRQLTGEFFHGEPPTPIPAALLATLPYQRVIPVAAIRAVVLEPEVQVRPGTPPQRILKALNLYLELVDAPPLVSPEPVPDELLGRSPRIVLVHLGRLTKLEAPRIANLVLFAGQVNTKILSAADVETITYTDFDA